MVNRADFTESGRRPDPENMIVAYSHAAMTLNFIRSLSAGGFADVHHPEYWELSFFRRAERPGLAARGVRADDARSSPRRCASWRRSARAPSRS